MGSNGCGAAMARGGAAEGLAAAILETAGFHVEREFRFHSKRRWRADLKVSRGDKSALVEIEGGIWTQGRHNRAQGYLADMEKYREAAVLGYNVLRFSTAEVNGVMLDTIRRYFSAGDS